MFNKFLGRVVALVLASVAGPVLAAVVTFSGNLGDAGNAALVASDLGAAQFTDDLATANNVALHALHVAVDGSARFASTGHPGGGIDPYVTLFRGSAPATATVVESNYLHALAVGGDFTLDLALTAGDYTLAIGVFQNMSFAENGGSGFLSDGFIGLGGPAFFGDGSYRLAVTLPDAGTVPEPGGAVLALTAACAAVCAAVWARRRRHSSMQTTQGGR